MISCLSKKKKKKIEKKDIHEISCEYEKGRFLRVTLIRYMFVLFYCKMYERKILS